MSNAAALLQSYPGTMNVDKDLLATAIDEALTCFQTCTACADAGSLPQASRDTI